MMTAIIPRRLFEVDEKPAEWVRATGSIPTSLNDRFKAMARLQGKTADQFIGELLMSLAPQIDRMEAKQEAERLRDRLGDNWLQILIEANQ